MLKSTKVAILGKNNIAVKCAEILLKHKEINVVACCPNNNDSGVDSWQPSFKKFCNSKDLNVLRIPKIRSKKSINLLKELELDFIFSFQYDQILNAEVINIPKRGAINLHFSPLPKYRGVSPLAFALINGEEDYGVTLHYMDPGVDTGDVISQILFNIKDMNNARELYEACEKYSIQLFQNSIKKIIAGKNNRKIQKHQEATYYSNGTINFSESYINFNKSTYMLQNWIRAFIFPPFQYPKFKVDGKKYEVINAIPIFEKNVYEKPGTLIEKNSSSFTFSTHDCYIKLETREQ